MSPIPTNPAPFVERQWPDPARARGRAWFVLHTKSRQEKKVVEVLEAVGVTAFLPLVTRRRAYAHRARVSGVPLFPCYVFMWGVREDAFGAIASKRAVKIIEAADQRALHHQLTQIHEAIERGAVLDPYPYLSVGRRVRVRSGSLKGVEGVIDERTRVDRLVLIVQALGQAVATEMDSSLLEPVD